MALKKWDSPKNRLSRIFPNPGTERFLIHWDTEASQLWYGLGNTSNAVRLSSRQTLENWDAEGAFGAKLTRETVHKFLDGCDRVPGTELLQRCASVLTSYVHFVDERVSELLAAWVIASYLYPMFGLFGYLFFYSSFPRSGKTRTEEVLSHLAFEASSPLNAPTVPTIRDTAREGRTLVLDTLERWKEKSADAYASTMELLDAGFRNGGQVAKMVCYGRTWVKEIIPVFAPYVLAGISRDSLTDTALDRSFPIEFHRKSVRIKKQKYAPTRCERECAPIRENLYLWALQNAKRVAAIYQSARLDAEVDALGLNDRAADIWKPLFAILKVMNVSEETVRLRSLAVDMHVDPEVAEDQKKLRIIRSLSKHVNGNDVLIGTTTTLLGYIDAGGVSMGSANKLQKFLTQFGFQQQSVRIAGGLPRYAWKIERSRLADIERELASH